MATHIGFLAIFSWGLLALLGNLTKAIPAFQLLFMCFALSFIILLVKRFASKQPLLTPPKLSKKQLIIGVTGLFGCLLYTSPSPRDKRQSRMPSSA